MTLQGISRVLRPERPHIEASAAAPAQPLQRLCPRHCEERQHPAVGGLQALEPVPRAVRHADRPCQLAQRSPQLPLRMALTGSRRQLELQPQQLEATGLRVGEHPPDPAPSRYCRSRAGRCALR